MKKGTKIFLYFVLIAPLLAKIFEWLFQLVTYGGWNHLANGVCFLQIIFILFLSLIIYAVMEGSGKFKGMNVIYVLGIAYFLKELYNFFFVYGMTINAGSIIAIVFEPIMIMFLFGYLPYIWFFQKKGGRR